MGGLVIMQRGISRMAAWICVIIHVIKTDREHRAFGRNPRVQSGLNRTERCGYREALGILRS
jgi:hypothetical protein